MGYRVSKFQWDSAAVLTAADRATKRALMKFGAFTRTRAITMLLRHKVGKGFGVSTKISGEQGTAPPGIPPYAHKGDLATRMQFDYDPIQQSVIIGPMKFAAKVGDDVPHALEEGGPSVLSKYQSGKKVLIGITVAAHPYMKPAFNAELEKAPELWHDQMKP